MKNSVWQGVASGWSSMERVLFCDVHEAGRSLEAVSRAWYEMPGNFLSLPFGR